MTWHWLAWAALIALMMFAVWMVAGIIFWLWMLNEEDEPVQAGDSWCVIVGTAVFYAVPYCCDAMDKFLLQASELLSRFQHLGRRFKLIVLFRNNTIRHLFRRRSRSV